MQDAFGREITYLRLSVTELCNLRCRYCMPEEGICKRPHEEMLTEEEMILAVKAVSELGVRKLRITGGEPLVKKNILSICEKAAALPGIEEVCITTNGTLLPGLAVPLRRAGVGRLNISLDTLDADKYRKITRVGRLDDALSGIEAALAAGFEKIKINTVLIGGFNDDEAAQLCRLTRRWPVDVRFIELMPMASDPMLGPGAFVPFSRIRDALPELVPQKEDGGVAKLYRLPGAQGCVGFISPVSEHFCGKCNRMRLTADGKFKPCLHSPLEFSIKGLDKEGMKQQFMRALAAKPEKHEVLSYLHRSQAARSMNQIGG